MSRCLITGGAGFIASHVAEHLRDAGHEVIVLDDLSGGSLRNVPDRVQFVQGDICDGQLVDHVFKTRMPQVVYHLGCFAAENLSHHIRRFIYRNIVEGSAAITNACVKYGVKTLVYTSSIAVYGSGKPPFTEIMPPWPEDPYGIAKYAVELDLAAARKHFGLEYIIFRPHNVVGARQNLGDRYRNVAAIFMNQIMSGKPMTIFGDGSQTRAFSCIEDIAPTIAESPFMLSNIRNHVFNIGGDTWYSVADLAVRVARAMGVKPEIVNLPARKEVQHAYCDHAKAALYLGYHDSTPLDEGLAKMAAWAKEHGPCVTAPFFNIELEKNLPEAWRDAP